MSERLICTALRRLGVKNVVGACEQAFHGSRYAKGWVRREQSYDLALRFAPAGAFASEVDLRVGLRGMDGMVAEIWVSDGKGRCRTLG